MKITLPIVVLFGALTLPRVQAQVYSTLYDEDWGAAYGSVPGKVGS